MMTEQDAIDWEIERLREERYNEKENAKMTTLQTYNEQIEKWQQQHDSSLEYLRAEWRKAKRAADAQRCKTIEEAAALAKEMHEAKIDELRNASIISPDAIFNCAYCAQQLTILTERATGSKRPFEIGFDDNCDAHVTRQHECRF